MKKVRIKSVLFAMLAMTSLASCNQNDDVQTASAPSTLVVKFGEGIKTYAVDAPVTGGASELNNVTIYLLQSNAVVGTHTLTAEELTDKKCTIEQVSGAVNNVLVVANVPADATLSTTSADAVRNHAFTIASQQSSGTNPGIEHVTLMGESSSFSTPTNPAGDGHEYKEVSVNLSALVARIEVGTVKAGVGLKSVALEAVYINNYFTDGSKSVTLLHAQNDVVWDSPFSTYTNLEYMNAANALVTNSGTKCYAFQVFAGGLDSESKMPHVILRVKGVYENDTTFENLWITFNKYHDGSQNITSMEQNKVYNLGKEIEINAKDLTTDPEMQKIDLGITVTITDWTVVGVTPGV